MLLHLLRLQPTQPSLARGLWRDHRRSPRAVRLVANLMLDYEVDDAPLWLAVLKQLQRYGQHAALLSLLEPLSGVACLRDSSAAGAMWQAVLLRPFEELAARGGGSALTLDDSSESGRRVLAVLEHVVLLLQRCPVLRFVDVARFVVGFRDLGPQFRTHAIR